eukprot:TRINITY_DN27480_c0_g2_i1.p1 TRINITY_DN27480_c0_g2~~TRINITY_DN27480_c0_g2_i1.p1  ORF type:complete len:479 (+),score=86.63 TRINITY_DN27480_c0_g2_i1:1183-2619(+)
MHKKARAAISRERKRLQRCGEVDPEFFSSFASSFGIRFSFEAGTVAGKTCAGLIRSVVEKDSENSATSPALSVDELPSLFQMLERRFGNDRADKMPTSPEQLAFQMLSHAEDNVRERWQVFPEVERALLHTIATSSSNFVSQLPCSNAADRCEAEALSASQIGWRRQICIVLLEACRGAQRCWRSGDEGGSCLALVRRLSIWTHVFDFIRPFGEMDVYNVVALVAEQLAEFLKSKQILHEGVQLARAWHLYGRALYDSSSRLAEDDLQSAVQDALCGGRADVVRRAPSSVSALGRVGGAKVPAAEDLDQAARHLVKLHTKRQLRARDCAEAASTFLAQGRCKVAAEAFADAAALTAATSEFARGFRRGGDHLRERLIVTTNAAAAEGRDHALRSARCWLLVARRAGCAGTCGEEALLGAAAQLAHAGEKTKAAACAARAGRFTLALRYLAGTAGHEARSLCFLCAVLICMSGQGRAFV